MPKRTLDDAAQAAMCTLMAQTQACDLLSNDEGYSSRQSRWVLCTLYLCCSSNFPISMTINVA